MSQYQHYIPQFLLRNFSHPYKQPYEDRIKTKGKRRPERGKYEGDKVLHVVDLASDDPRVTEVPVSRCFGKVNMYEAIENAISSNIRVEEKLSKLECAASVIIQKIKKSYLNKDVAVWLTRDEKNKLRKFLFIMKYRGPTFFDKYFSDNAQVYDSEDKYLLKDYMTAKEMAFPKEVWLHNLQVILDLDMDAKGIWMDTLSETMFPADAAMFIFHTGSSYMAFCVTENESDQFILTDRCYNIFEGPNYETYSASMGDYLGTTFVCYHEFGPISPNLIIVLRSNILPNETEDTNMRIKQSRDIISRAVAAQFPDPKTVHSMLLDLPVAKATNSYSNFSNGRIELATGASGIPHQRDKFCFRFWPISTRHVDLVNSIFLDNIQSCKTIACHSTLSLRKTLEVYVTGTTSKFKQANSLSRGTPVSRLSLLEKFARILQTLGSEVVPAWKIEDLSGQDATIQSFDDTWLEMMKILCEPGASQVFNIDETLFWSTYEKLDGSSVTFVQDLEQSWRLYKLQALVFTVTEDLEDDLRNTARYNLLELIVEMLPRRVWMYVKHRRWMLSKYYASHHQMPLGSQVLYAAKTEAFFGHQQEDEVVMHSNVITST